MKSFKPGDYLVIDQESGLTEYASDCGYDWNGVLKRKDQFDGEHPIYRFRNYDREKYPSMINPDITVTAYSNIKPSFIGNTSVSAPPGPADHLFD